MRHRIFTGPFAALEARWLAEAALLQAHDSLAPVVTLVGSNLLASYLKLQIARQGRSAANLRFYTFLDLATRLAEESDGDSQKPRLPHLGASAILESILVSQAPEVFRRVTAYPGFRNALLDTFRDLRDAGISPGELEAGVRACIAGNPDRNEHLSGLVSLYSLFRKKVEQFRGVDEDFRAASSNASLAEQSLHTRQLLIYGIYDVTGQQSDLLSELKQALDLTYFIPYVDQSVSAFADAFLSARRDELGVRHEVLEAELPPGGLGQLWQAGFGFGAQGTGSGKPSAPQPAPDDGSFAIVSAPGESRVAVEIVREILSALRDGVIHGFHEAAVVLRQPETDIPNLAEAMRLRGIPFFVEGGIPFRRQPLSSAVLAIARLEAESFSRHAILTAMEWICAALPEDSASVWDIAEWRALTNDLRFFSGIHAWTEGTDALVRDATRSLHRAEAQLNNPELEEEVDQMPIPSVASARHKLESAQSLRRGWEQVRLAASEWPAALSWREWSRLLQEKLEPLLAISPDWARFSTVLDELGSLSEMTDRAGIGPAVSRAKLTATLEESLSALSCPEGRFMRKGVNLISVSAARGLRFPLVIVPGLEEGKFPARLRQDPLLLDEERGKIGRLPLKRQRGDEEKLIFDMVSRSASRRLVFVTSRLDEGSDRERIPSEFLLRMAAAARASAVGLRDLAQGSVPGFRSVSLENPAPAGGQVAVDRGEIRLRLITGYQGSKRTMLDVLAREEADLILRPLAFDDARWQPTLTAFDGRFADHHLIRHIAAVHGPAAGPVSASRLEAYSKCPFLFYLSRVMELQAWKEPEAPQGLDPLERGRVVHEILEKFLAEYPGAKFHKTGIENLLEALIARARLALENVRPSGIPDLLWEIECMGLERLLRNWLIFEKERTHEGLFPAGLERPFGRFGKKASYPELRVQAGKHKFVFRGRIDRVDLSTDGKHARIIDYKTGNLPESMGGKKSPLLMAGEKMQVAVYPGVLSSLEGFEKVERIEGEYLHLQPKDGEVVSCYFDEKKLNEAAARLPEVLEVIGDGIVSGIFFARSSGTVRPHGHCDFCDYLTICGKDRKQREERKSSDPAVLRFGRLVEIDQPMEDEQ